MRRERNWVGRSGRFSPLQTMSLVPDGCYGKGGDIVSMLLKAVQAWICTSGRYTV